jgi:pyruvyltransferase
MIHKYISVIKNFYNLITLPPEDVILIYMPIAVRNWGDALSLTLVKELSKKTPVAAYPMIKWNGKPLLVSEDDPIYSVVGSNIQFYCHEPNLVIWGSGFISSECRLSKEPRQICAVRGPLTQELIQKSGFDCPDIFGDPAMLYPLFYRPVVKKRYKLGIVPNFIEKNHPFLEQFRSDPDIHIIDIEGEINTVVDEINACEKIASSSLHGIIAADSYGIPSTWIEFSNMVVGSGFKFQDYFRSVGREDEKSLKIAKTTRIQTLYEQFHDYSVKFNKNKLLEACPFKSESVNYCEIKNDINRRGVMNVKNPIKNYPVPVRH